MLGERIGKYRVIRSLDEGPGGRVFEAVHEDSERRVAIKLERAVGPETSFGEMLNEAQTAVSLKGPGVIMLHDFGILPDQRRYLAYEYLSGRSLKECLDQRGPLPLVEVAQLGWQMASLLANLHAQGISHGDLKPDNFFVLGEGVPPRQAVVKLLDFGSSVNQRRPERLQTDASQKAGTIGYRAPERFLRGPPKPHSDVYSLGVILCELAHGLPLFLANSEVETRALQHSSLSTFLNEAGLPSPLSSLLLQMLAETPEKRPLMSEVAARLERLSCVPPRMPTPQAPSSQFAAHETPEGDCPFPGLHAFDESLSRFFFGRETEIQEALRRIGHTPFGLRRWLQIEGPSGAGKSSLVHAGIAPAIRAGLLDGGPLYWEIVKFRPGPNPLERLAQILAATKFCSGETDAGQITARLRSSPTAFSELLKHSLLASQGLLLFIDQLEELFLLADDFTKDILLLDAALASVLSDPEVPLFLVTTVRSDFLDRFAAAPNLARLLNQASRYYLPSPGHAELLRAIVQPARMCGLEFSSGLPEEIAADAARAEASLPLMAHVLRALWTQREDRVLTRQAYQRLGGVGGALARSADELLAGLSPEGRERARRLLLELVRPGRGSAPTRRVLTRHEVLHVLGRGEETMWILARLSGGQSGGESETAAQQAPAIRLVVVIGDEQTEPAHHRVTLAHDALLQYWTTLRVWIRADQQLLLRRDEVENAAQTWESAGKPAQDLPGGTSLAYLLGEGLEPTQAQHFRTVLSARADGFLEAAYRLNKRRRRQRRTVIASLIAALCLVSGLSAVTGEEYFLARRRLREATVASDGIVTAIENKLFRIPGAEAVGRELLQQLSSLLDRLLVDAPDDLPALRCRAVVYYRSAELLRNRGELSRARTESTSAVATAERLADKYPNSREAQEVLGASYIQLGDQEKFERKWDAARSAYRSAQAVERRLTAPGTKDVGQLLEHMQKESICLDGLGDIALAQGHIADASAAYEESYRLKEQILQKDGSNPQYRYSASVVLYRLGDIQFKRGELATARTFYQRSRDMQRALLQEGHRQPEYRRTLSGIAVRQGDTFLEERIPATAHDHYEEAQQLAENLVENEPENMKYLKALLISRAKLALSDLQMAQCAHYTVHLSAVQAVLPRIHKQSSSLIDPQLREFMEQIKQLAATPCR